VQDKEQATFAWSTKGWTDKELELEWMEQNFEKYTIEIFVPLDLPSAYANCYSAKGKTHILMLDRHGSHLTWQFFNFCLKSNIHSISIPAHSTHILPPLDVGQFGRLSHSYSNDLDIWIRQGGNAIKKGQFYN